MFLFLLLLLGFRDVLGSPALRSWEEEACSVQKLKGQSRYTCTDGKINCLPGWIGDLCQVPVCGNDCDPQHGYCTKPKECKCNLGYSGPGCRECVKLPGCQHGSCRKSFQCNCDEGWSGMFCTAPACPASCDSRRGQCKEPNVCSCRPGYTGEDCGSCEPRKGCVHGSCNRPGECTCKEGWEGRLCDKPICAPGCKGVCREPGGCRCDIGWQGEDCNECVMYPGCVNGNCSQPWQCNCTEGWGGRLCDTPTWEEGWRSGQCTPLGAFLCMNGGTEICNYWADGSMATEPICACPPTFTGQFCEYPINENPIQDTTSNTTTTTESPPPAITTTVLTVEEEIEKIADFGEILKTKGKEDPSEGEEKLNINHTQKLSNVLQWKPNPNRYIGGGRRKS